MLNKYRNSSWTLVAASSLILQFTGPTSYILLFVLKNTAVYRTRIYQDIPQNYQIFQHIPQTYPQDFLHNIKVLPLKSSISSLYPQPASVFFLARHLVRSLLVPYPSSSSVATCCTSWRLGRRNGEDCNSALSSCVTWTRTLVGEVGTGPGSPKKMSGKTTRILTCVFFCGGFSRGSWGGC